MTASDDPTRPAAPAAGNDATPRETPTTGHDQPRPDGTRPDGTAAETPTSGRRAAERPAQEPVAVEEPQGGGGKTAGMWIGLILGAIILVLLLIFVIQNNVSAGFQYFGAQFDLPLGVAMLLAAIAGALVMALVGSVRMIQMSWTIRKLRKQQEKILRVAR